MLTRLSKRGKIFLSYVRSEHIGTVGCSTSPTLYGTALNRRKGLDQCVVQTKPLYNIGKVAYTWATGERGGNFL